MRHNSNSIELAERLIEELDKCDSVGKVDNSIIAEIVYDNIEEMELLANNLTSVERRDKAHKAIERIRYSKNFELLNKRRRRAVTKRRLLIAAKLTGAAAAIFFAIALIFNQDDKRAKSSIAVVNKVVVELPIITKSSGEAINIKEEVIKLEDYIAKEATKKGSSTEEEAYSEIKIPKHTSYTVILADNSEVILNAGSSLRYPEGEFGATREVVLSGEAFFKVTKSDKPFIVICEGLKVRVYGTEFNIKMVGNTIETLLVEGSIGVTSTKGSEVMLEPNQLATYNEEDGSIVTKSVDINDYISWISGYFKYVDTPLSNALHDLNLWYGIEFKNIEKYDGMSVTLFTSRSSSIEEVVKLLEKATGTTIIRNGKKQFEML